MMDRRTFTLQLRDKPPRWLPHKHRCPKCSKDHWCTYRDDWNPCLGLLVHQPHSEPCPRSAQDWSTTPGNPYADMNAFLKMIKRQSGRPMQPHMVPISKAMVRYLSNDPHAQAMIQSRVDRIRGQHADYIFVDDPAESA